ncbi:MAG: hypothetical protein HDQ87_06040 [Clostridia bacterium]|nr:hypothetical protein [Clostridia bacterium]
MQIQGAALQGTAFGAYPGIRDRVAGQSSFASAAEAARETEYVQHLQSKYGAHFRVESIPRDPDALERAGRAMHGDDVVIAPNIVSEMARDPEVAAWYEGAIDHCFDMIPTYTAQAAARGLTFEPCGVVVHDDGTVTFICGGGDSPERVAQVNAINAARDAKRAAQRRAQLEAAAEHAQEMRRLDHDRILSELTVMQVLVSAHSGTPSA